jgi:16S rRNA (adenine1518-N6/adenine1519-N6)-dimethyltransferase
MSLAERTKKLLKRNRIFPSKRLGQSFMIDADCLHSMAYYTSLSKEDVVLEVGAGFGVLTQILSPLCAEVIAVEVDRRLVEVLRKELTGFDNVVVVEGDVLEARIPKFNKVVANPPFHISSAILFWLLEKSFDLAVLTFQQEFAERLVANVGSKNYSRLTVETYYRAKVELLETVPKEAFLPQPDVDACIVRLKPRSAPPFHVKSEQVFHDLVRTLFTQRNRKVRNAVTDFLHRGGKKESLADSLLFHESRVRELAPEDFGAIANELAD